MASAVNSCFRTLAAAVIFDALTEARAGNQDAKEWLTQSQRVEVFCAGLNISHCELVTRRWPVLKAA